MFGELLAQKGLGRAVPRRHSEEKHSQVLGDIDYKMSHIFDTAVADVQKKAGIEVFAVSIREDGNPIATRILDASEALVRNRLLLR